MNESSIGEWQSLGGEPAEDSAGDPGDDFPDAGRNRKR